MSETEVGGMQNEPKKPEQPKVVNPEKQMLETPMLQSTAEQAEQTTHTYVPLYLILGLPHPDKTPEPSAEQLDFKEVRVVCKDVYFFQLMVAIKGEPKPDGSPTLKINFISNLPNYDLANHALLDKGYFEQIQTINAKYGKPGRTPKLLLPGEKGYDETKFGMNPKYRPPGKDVRRHK